MNVFSNGLIDFKLYASEQPGTENVKPAGDYIDEISASLGTRESLSGHCLPWGKIDREFRLRDGELTLWAGINGHGKSQMTGFVAADLIAARRRVCIASMEMKPTATLRRMLRQFTGFNPDDDFAQTPQSIADLRDLYGQFKTQAHDLLWIYDQMGTVDTKVMLGVVRYCAKELRIEHMFVDSLMKCVKGADDYNAQKDFVAELFSICQDYKMSIHLIHHIRKLDNEAKIPDKMDIKGAGEITDIVDNVLTVWRNKAENKKPDDPDAVLSVCKQRHNGWEGKIKLFYDQESQQYIEERGATIDFFRRCA
jgi:twinkle protein